MTKIVALLKNGPHDGLLRIIHEGNSITLNGSTYTRTSEMRNMGGSWAYIFEWQAEAKKT